MLSPQDTYTCPLCRHGELSSMTLMDAFACGFCRHLFTANFEQQMLQLADGDRPLAWYWTDRGWRTMAIVSRGQGPLAPNGWPLWILSAAIVIFPPTLIGLGAYIFPPDPQSTGAWLPLYWTGLTFLVHLTLVAWLLVEYYQWPVYQALKIRLERLLRS